jgi:hypothetical protein
MKKIIVLVLSVGVVLAEGISPAPSFSGLPDYVAHGGLVALVLWFWRQDRTDRSTERLELAKQYAALATDFRRIVQENTNALVSLRDAISREMRPHGIE